MLKNKHFLTDGGVGGKYRSVEGRFCYFLLTKLFLRFYVVTIKRKSLEQMLLAIKLSILGCSFFKK